MDTPVYWRLIQLAVELEKSTRLPNAALAAAHAVYFLAYSGATQADFDWKKRHPEFQVL